MPSPYNEELDRRDIKKLGDKLEFYKQKNYKMKVKIWI